MPAYQVLADALRAKILAGELEPGRKLPIEPELSAQYGVSRSTVREALRVLASQNLIATTRGVSGGSFVAPPNPEQISGYLEASRRPGSRRYGARRTSWRSCGARSTGRPTSPRRRRSS